MGPEYVTVTFRQAVDGHLPPLCRNYLADKHDYVKCFLVREIRRSSALQSNTAIVFGVLQIIRPVIFYTISGHL